MLAKIAAIVATLDETNGAPESSLYIFFDMNMNAWTKARSIMIESKLIEINGHFVTLTADGRETARKLNAALAKTQTA